MSTPILWIVFAVLIAAVLALDLGVFHRRSHAVRIREALAWTAAWVGLALGFMGFVFFTRGPDSALEFLTAYLIEESLSVDNLFVFLIIFTHFRVPRVLQHKVLFWGIAGAVVLRALFIVAGVALIERFHWVVYIFGAVLIVSGVKMLFQSEVEIDFEKNIVLRLVRRVLRVKNTYEEGRFVTRDGGKLCATTLLVVLLVVEATDVLFAVDSIPAVLAVSRDPFIVYTSNVFAILGLRSLFFALAGLLQYFHFLNYGLCVILCFVGVKMTVSGFYKLPVALSLGVIAGVLAVSVIASLLWPAPSSERTHPHIAPRPHDGNIVENDLAP